MRAEWNGAVIAESDRTVVVEGNHYFPPDSLRSEHLVPSAMLSVCYWKGVARYRSIEVGGGRLGRAAWCYRRPPPWVRRIKEHVAFGPRVTVRPVR